jgi:hypothetical protein
MKLSKILCGMFGAKPSPVRLTADDRHVMLETAVLSLAVYDPRPLRAAESASWGPAWHPFAKNALVHRAPVGDVVFAWRWKREVVPASRPAAPQQAINGPGSAWTVAQSVRRTADGTVVSTGPVLAAAPHRVKNLHELLGGKHCMN